MQARDRGQDSFKPVLEPGKGIGGINLGAPVHEVLAILQKHPDVFSNIEIKFCAQDICSMDLLIECPDIGMNIICGASEQRVRLIEFYRPREFAILYCDVACCGPKVLPTFPAVYHLLGPAMPGVYKQESQMYWLAYPGVTFMFPISPEFAHMFKDERDLTMVLPDRSSPVAGRIRIHPMHDCMGSLPPPLDTDSLYMEPIKVTIEGMMTFQMRGCSLDYTSTPQDVLALLGKPSTAMQKRVDKLRIHAKQAAGCAHYFFNYSDLGIDLLFDARQHSICKMVMHTNCPEHADFNDYTKCNFRLTLSRSSVGGEPDTHHIADADDPEGVVEIGPDTRWSEIESVLGPPKGGKPLIHTDRAVGGASGHSLFFGYERVIFEVTRLGNLATVILYRR